MSALEADTSVPDAAWPEAISDGLTLPCADCGQVPRFDYHVIQEFWARWVPGPERLGVVCLPCLDLRCGGVGLAEALEEIQWTGTGHTVVLKPTFRHEYEARANTSAAGSPWTHPTRDQIAVIVHEARKLVAAHEARNPEHKWATLNEWTAIHEIDCAIRALNRYLDRPKGAEEPAGDPEVREAARALADTAARAVCEPRRFHENADYIQQELGGAVAAMRAALAAPPASGATGEDPS